MIRLMASHSAALFARQTALCSRPELSDRAEMGAAVIAALNGSGIPYCVLGESSSGLAFSGSDMDFVVPPTHAQEIPAVLAVAASAAGGRLVQAIQHESTGWYFVMARQRGGRVTFFNPDCTTDYRRDGRLWLYADELLCQRTSGEVGVSRPTAQSNFTYYLLKQVLKGTLSDEQWHRLRQLHVANDSRCDMTEFWADARLAELQWALLRGNREWLRAHRRELLEELQGSAFREPATARLRAKSGEAHRVLRRLLQPTGLLVRVRGGSAAHRAEFAWRLAESLAPAFRRSWVVEGASASERVRVAVRVFAALVSSTLVVTTEVDDAARRFFAGVDVALQPEQTSEENLRIAIDAVLEHLARRTARRLGLAAAAQSKQLMFTAESETN